MMEDSDSQPVPGKRRRMKLCEAAAYLGVTTSMMSRLVRRGVLSYTVNPFDRRLKLVSVEDLDRLKEQALIEEEED